MVIRVSSDKMAVIIAISTQRRCFHRSDIVWRVLLRFKARMAFAGGVSLAFGMGGHAAGLENFGEPNIQRVWVQLANLERGTHTETVRILQLGDSHTAGEYFSHVLRTRLQARFGNAGYGWLTPGYVSNQRSAQVSQRMLGQWKMKISKSYAHANAQAHAGDDYPLGGMVNIAASDAGLEITPKAAFDGGPWRLTLWTKGNDAGGVWNVTLPDGQTRTLSAPPDARWSKQDVLFKPVGDHPLRLTSTGIASELGGIVLDRLAPGVAYDNLGIVGAQVRVVRNWNRQLLAQQLRWRKPDLVVLAYGTNEAFDSGFNETAYRNDLRAVIQQVRDAVPTAALLLVGAPSSAKKSGVSVAAGCGQYGLAPGLLAVQRIQREVASSERLLYWNWAEAMGGNCAIVRWARMSPPRASADLVHLAPKGYENSGNAL